MERKTFVKTDAPNSKKNEVDFLKRKQSKSR